MRKILGFSVLLLLLAGGGPVLAQMSDEAVVRYAMEAKQSGKSDQQIGRELLAKGVTPQQAERLKRQYEAGMGKTNSMTDSRGTGQSRSRLSVRGTALCSCRP